MALTDNLISYWKLDEVSGNALDAHGSNTLTENGTGGVGTATGRMGNARDFEAGDVDYFSIADNADLSTGDIDFTVQAWVKLESDTEAIILGKWAVGSLEYSLVYLKTNYGSGSVANRFHFSVSHNGSTALFQAATSFGAPSVGTWYLVHGWHDSVNNVIGVSINAGTANTTSYTTGVYNGTAKFRIGAQDAAGSEAPWDGLIDEVGFWKRVLTSSERASLYNAGRGLAYPFSDAPLTIGLLSCYELDESSGNAVDALAGNNATLTGSSASATGKISGARSLTGSTNKFESSIVPTGYPISMSCWVKTTNTSATLRDPFFLGHSSVNDHYFGLQLATNHKPVWSYSMILGGLSSWYITGPTAINDGNWHHLVGISRSKNDHQLYVDGVSAGTDTTNIGDFTSLDRQTLGALNYGGSTIQYYIGDLDQCALWFADITSLISTLYNSGNGFAYSGWNGGHPCVARSHFTPYMNGNNRFIRVG